VPLSTACLRSNCDRRSYLEKIWRITRSLIRSRLIDLSRKTATILAVHEGMVDHLIRGGISENSIEVLRNPVTPWSEKRIAAEKNHKFLFVGRLDHDKGAHLLAESARNAGVTLQMVGDGPLRPILEQTFPEVELMGWQSRENVAQIARGARVVVMPTGSRETFGLVAFEALTSGIPVIISKFAACDEIVRNDIGLSCDPYDARALADVLRSLAADDHRLRLMSERAWRMRSSLALSNRSWGDHLLSIYERAGRRDAEIGNLVGTYGA
jgi:glycosyltransferase involved in cell wall biosynthesis